MTLSRDQLRWNGWGQLGRTVDLSRAQERSVLRELGRRLGRELAPADAPVAIDELEIPDSRVKPEPLEALRAACGDAGVRTGAVERVGHALGRSLPDLLRLRRGEIPSPPDAVVYPPDEGAVAAVLRIASEWRLAVVPFGGGTSVVGGVEPRPTPEQEGAIALDTTRLDSPVRIDPEAGLATFQAGIDGPSLERALGARGLTLGHFPQSFEHSTLGGWIATRSAGQQSDGYGAIEDLVVSLRVVTPEGVIRTLDVPRSASGPDLNALVLGSEGTLGAIVEATLRVRPAPAAAIDRGMLFRSFADGVAAVRDVVRGGVPVSMLRLSDASETELSQVLHRDPTRRFDPSAALLSAVGRFGYGPGRAALVYGAEGADAAAVRAAARRVRRLGMKRGGLPLGGSPGRRWRRDRFRTPYLRDWLLDFGVAVDTLETSLSWGRIEAGHREIRRALERALDTHAGAGIVFSHLSHSYLDGACLYFTVLYALDPSSDLAQWAAIKREGTDAIVGAGGTLSHHHGVGSDHLPWMSGEKGALGLESLRAVKRAVDPAGVMNPGKLL